MIEVFVEKDELFNEDTGEFIVIPETTLRLEHSLVSVRKWESKWHKPFLNNTDKTTIEMLDYIRCMSLEESDPLVYSNIRGRTMEQIIQYIENPMTATWFSDRQNIGASKTPNEVVTAEIIYYWMITYRVPLEMEHWHLNQLLTLLKVLSIKNGGEKKMGKREAREQRIRLNEERKKKYNTKG